MRVRAILVVLLIGLQLVDIGTTNVSLPTPGVREGNPVMAWAQREFGQDWWIVKASLAGAGIYALSELPMTWPLNLATGFYSAIVISNVRHLPVR
jgi:hypothetical protein